MGYQTLLKPIKSCHENMQGHTQSTQCWPKVGSQNCVQR